MRAAAACRPAAPLPTCAPRHPTLQTRPAQLRLPQAGRCRHRRAGVRCGHRAPYRPRGGAGRCYLPSARAARRACHSCTILLHTEAGPPRCRSGERSLAGGACPAWRWTEGRVSFAAPGADFILASCNDPDPAQAGGRTLYSTHVLYLYRESHRRTRVE